MRAWIMELWREGRPKPLWQFATIQPVFGELRLKKESNVTFRRTMLSTRLVNPGAEGAADILTPLQDAFVVDMRDNMVTISGLQEDTFRTFPHGNSYSDETSMISRLELGRATGAAPGVTTMSLRDV